MIAGEAQVTVIRKPAPVAQFGVGILLDKLTMKVTGCIPGLAADRSGMILPGDEIVKINGGIFFCDYIGIWN